MAIFEIGSPDGLPACLEQLQAGDCLRAERFSCLAQDSRALIALAGTLREKNAALICAAEGIDTRDDDSFFRICEGLAALDRQQLAHLRQAGIDRAKADGRYKGRKPIAVDEALFDAVAACWERGEITAREAMSRLELKPNTFYRRIKEREANKMKEYKQVEKELRTELRESSRQARESMDDLKKQVKAEAKELKRTADETLDAHDVERELRRARSRAEAEHKDELRQMKKDVESETRELKKLLQEEE